MNVLKVWSVVLLFLSACSSVSPHLQRYAEQAAAVSRTDLMLTGKLPTDQIAELITRRHCSLLKKMKDGGPFCRSDDYGQVVESPHYCYQSLGGVDCYTKPDPYRTGAETIDQ